MDFIKIECVKINEIFKKFIYLVHQVYSNFKFIYIYITYIYIYYYRVLRLQIQQKIISGVLNLSKFRNTEINLLNFLKLLNLVSAYSFILSLTTSFSRFPVHDFQ